MKAEPGNYLALRRTWRTNDVIDVRIPFSFYLAPVMDQPNVASVFYGPVLLAAEEPAPRSDWRPVALDAGDLAKSVKGDPATLRFTIDGVPFKPVLRNVRAEFGVPARDPEVEPQTCDRTHAWTALSARSAFSCPCSP